LPSAGPPVVKASAAVILAKPKPVAPGTEWFREVKSTGIDFRHMSGTNEEKPFPAANGSGLAAFDYDLDGRYDLYFATGKPFPIDAAATGPVNRCYRSLSEWHFEEVTAETGLGHAGYSAGVAVGDYDSDGFPDVFVSCYGADVLFHNCGDGTFRRLDEAGVADERWGASAAFLDADGDGLLDLYVANYAKWTWEQRRWCGDSVRKIREYCSPHSVEPETDVLFQNSGDGRFVEATTEFGLARAPARGQGVITADLDGDGHCDLYVANDLHPNFLFFNQGGGRFLEATESSGAAYDHEGKVRAGMGVDVADVNADGKPDLYITNFSNEPNTIFESLGQGMFQEATMQRGMYHDSLPYVGWGTALADFNLDGWPDVMVTNGPLRANEPPKSPPLAWENVRGRFRFLGAEAGEYFLGAYDTRALATADLDNDGDLDVVIGHQDGQPTVLENRRLSRDSSAASITLRLVGRRANRDCIGATISAAALDPPQLLLVKGGGSYLSASDLRQIVALPPQATAISCLIHWPGGERSQVENLLPGKEYIVVEPQTADQPPWVVEVSR
jgi:hypothetical protein